MKKRISALVLALVLCMALAAPAFAYARVDAAKETSLALSYVKEDEEGIKDMEIRIYQIADMSDAVRFTPAANFAGVDGLQNLLNEGKWAEMVSPLLGYLEANEAISPAGEVKTDVNGLATFSGLSVGAYLVTGSAVKDGYYTYTPQSFVTTLPMLDENDEWHYDAEGNGKFEEKYNPPSSSNSVTVRKVWSDNNDEAELRPDSITVQLLKNGQPYGNPVVLTKAGGWMYTWRNLDKNASWSVTEVEVEGYITSISASGTTFTITNTLDGVELPDDPPPQGGGDWEELEDPDVPLGELPQTGLLQWPIPLMAAAGLFLLMLGMVSERKRKSEQ